MGARLAIVTLLAVVAGAPLAGCQGLRTEVHGSGTVVSESRTVSGFDRISISGPGVLTVAGAETESLQIEAEDNILAELTSSVSNGRLELGHDAFTNIVPTRPITYRITTRQLSGINVAGSAEATVSIVDKDRFEVIISGSGSVTIEGSTRQLTVDISGSGAFLGEALQADVADVSVSGSGHATVNASDDLTASVSGSGSISYIGTPNLHESVSGSGSIGPR